MEKQQLNGHNAITAGMMVRLTSEKIDKLQREKKLSEFPGIEGRVSRVFDRYKPSVFDININGIQIILPETDIESVN